MWYRSMLISILKFFPLNEKRQEILETLLSVKGPVQASPGCLSCSISEESGEECILYIEQWRSLLDLERHVRGSSYARILEAMELSALVPEVSFYETGDMWNLDLVMELRNKEHHNLRFKETA